MLLTEIPTTRESFAAIQTGRFALRVHSPAGAYEVALPYGKTTIGSSPRCNVRIQQPGVHPLECLIVCEAGGMTVRRWAAETLLNGAPFDEAPLAAGDHLSLAAVDLEVVCGHVQEHADACREAGRVDEPPAEHAPFSWGKETIHHTTVWIGEDEDEAALGGHRREEPAERHETAFETAGVLPADAAREVFRQLQAANASSRARGRKLLDALCKNRDACRGLQAQVDGLTNTKDELVAEYAAVARDRAMLHDQLATAEQRYSEWDHQSHEWDKLRREWDATRADWDRDRAEWSRQVGDWESRLAGHVSRIEELESLLAEARAQDAESQSAPAEGFESPATVTQPEHVEPSTASWPASHSHAESSSAPEQMTSTGDVSAAADSQPAGETHSPITPPSMWDQGMSDAATRGNDHAESAEAEAPAWEQQRPAEPPVWERHTPAWESEAPSWEDVRPAQDDQSPAWNNGAPQEEEEAPIKPETDIASTPAVGGVSDAETAPHGGLNAAHQNASLGPENPRADLPSTADAKPQPVSYIERYSHMFGDEGATKQTPPTGTSPQPAVDKGAAATDEESIEDYMAKLLQRVRGDRPVVAASQAAKPVVARQPVASKPSPATFAGPTPAQTPANASATDANAGEPSPRPDEQFLDLSELVRKAPVVEQNFDALRALANESARRHIGVHATKKHRRDACTKFIVASLAGMTSLWLMMLAPGWRDVQFIAACVSLMIATYWAGQTYGELVEMSLAGDFDRPEPADDVEESSVEG